MTKDIFVPPSGPPQGSGPSRETYEAMGEENIFLMLEDFYRALGRSSIAGLFPKSEEALIAASRKSAAFFTGLLGGPPLYHQQFGPPRMRARHIPFPISPQARLVWVEVFYTILDDAERYNFPEEHLDGFKDFLASFSAWMVNQPG